MVSRGQTAEYGDEWHRSNVLTSILCYSIFRGLCRGDSFSFFLGGDRRYRVATEIFESLSIRDVFRKQGRKTPRIESISVPLPSIAPYLIPNDMWHNISCPLVGYVSLPVFASCELGDDISKF